MHGPDDTTAVAPANQRERPNHEEGEPSHTFRKSVSMTDWVSGASATMGLFFAIYLSTPPPVEAYNICTCQCCYSGICIDRPNSEEWNGTFQVPGCSFCTKSLCFEHIQKPIGSCDEVSATCVDYDTYWRLTVILLILFLLASLLVIGCLRDVPMVKRFFKLN